MINIIFLLILTVLTIKPSVICAQAESVTPPISPSPTVAINPNSGIYLSEFMPNSSPEWIEIYNSNSYEVQLEAWKLVDRDSNIKNISTINILPGSQKVVFSGSNFLNNDGDTIKLIDNNGIERDNYSYSEISSDGLSWNKINNSWCFAVISKDTFNNPCYVTPTLIPIPTSIPTSIPEPTSAPTPINTPTNTNTPTPTSTPTSKPTPTLTPTKKMTPTPTEDWGLYSHEDESLLSTNETQLSPETDTNSILGTSDIITPTPILTPSPQKQNKSSQNILPILFISIGGILLLTPLIISKLSREKKLD